MKNIAAYTAPTIDSDYVPFISVNRSGEREELVKVSVRQKGQGKCPYAEIEMTKPEFALFLIEALHNL